MMSPLEDVDVSPTHIEFGSGAPACVENPPRVQEEMVFYQRPGISGRQLVLSPRRTGLHVTKFDALAAPPVQLVSMDGTTYLGIPAAAAATQSRSRNTGTGVGAGRDGRSGNASPAANQDALGRLLVTTNPVVDRQSKRRIRHLQLAMLIAAIANVALTVALLFPDGRDAWYNTDAYTSALAATNAKRVRALRPPLVALAILTNSFGVASAFLRREGLLTVFVFALVCSDTLSMVLLLPHVFFLLRFLFDLILVLLATETRGNLEHAWFVTNFHRLRY